MRNCQSLNKNRQQGLSLIELLVSMALGVVLSYGVSQVYLTAKVSYSQDEQLARMQENARYALKKISREMVMAGFLGGQQIDSVTTVAVTNDCGTNWAIETSLDPLEFVNNVADTETSLCADGGGNVEAGTDMLGIRRSADERTVWNGYVLATNPKTDTVAKEGPYLQINSGGVPSVVAGKNLDSSAVVNESGYDVWEFYANTFWIRNYSRNAGDGIPTLMNASLSSTAMSMSEDAIVDGIQNMQIEWGLDTDGDLYPNHYQSTLAAAEVEEVVAARIFLLARTAEELPDYQDTKTYTLGTTVVGPYNDRFMRRVFSTTVRMRNLNIGEL
jgi:prepilin-type N-terminal cleavage/methylation domain-containing protein